MLDLWAAPAQPDHVVGWRQQQINLAPQYLLNCGNETDAPDVGSCRGGSAYQSFAYIHAKGIVDETCCPYRAEDLWRKPAGSGDKASTCIAEMTCRNCDFENGCYAVEESATGGAGKYRRYWVDEYGPVGSSGAAGVHAIQAEIFTRGPIACSINASNPEFEGLHYEGYNDLVAQSAASSSAPIFKDAHPEQNTDTTHVISLVGWGDDPNGGQYWIGRNSWGSYWGLSDWFLIEKGTNALLVEDHCYFATPSLTPVHGAS